jgi:mRNA interferase YafQ
MLKPEYTKKFSKDVKRVIKRGLDQEELKEIIRKLIKEEPLDAKHKDHNLIGNFANCRDCHIEPDWLLIYMIKTEENRIIFLRTGTHSDLFKK